MIERTHYRPEEFRKMLGIGRTTLWRLIRSGKITVDRSLGFPLIPATCLPTCHPARNSEKRRDTLGERGFHDVIEVQGELKRRETERSR